MRTTDEYRRLLAEYAPRAITNEREYDRTARLAAGLRGKRRRSTAEKRLGDLLELLIYQYELSARPTPRASRLLQIPSRMKEQNYDALRLAEDSGVPRRVITYLLKGSRRISPEQLDSLARCLDVRPIDFWAYRRCEWMISPDSSK